MPSTAKSTLTAGGLVMLSALLLYGRTAGYGFVWDDHQLVEQNPLVTGAAPWQQIWGGSLFTASSPEQARFYRPLVVSSYRLNWAISPHPAGFHLVNVLLHGACAVLLLLLARRSGATPLAALIGALLFVGWSGHTEGVGWVAGRSDLLLALGVLLMLLALLPRAETGTPPGPARSAPPWAAMLGALAGGLIAVLSKEPGLVITAATCALAISLRSGTDRRRRLLLALPVAVATVIGLTLRLVALGEHSWTQAVGDQSLAGRAARLGAQLQLLSGFDLRLLVDVPPAGSRQLLVALAGLFALGLGILATWLWQRGQRPAASLLLLGLLALLPAATARLPALRYLYLPLALWMAALALGLSGLAAHPKRRLAYVIIGALALGWVAMGQARLGAWHDDDRLFALEAAQSPENPDAQFFHASRLLARGKPRRAAQLLQRTLERNPSHRPSWIVLGQAWLVAGELDRAEQTVRLSLRGEPRTSPQFVLLGRVLWAKRQPALALDAFEQALGRSPRSPAALRGALSCARSLGRDALAQQYEARLRGAPSSGAGR